MPASYETHRAQLKAILSAWGMPEQNAEATADVLSWADLHGVDSHGISMLPGYDRLRRSRRANMAARPRVLRGTPVSALVDGDGGLGHVPARFAMQVAIDKAKQAGMAITAVRNSAHFGATGYYTLMAAKEGLIGMACTGASSIQVAPTFGRGSQARHRPLVLCRSDGGWAAVFARYGDDDRGRRPHPQQGQRGGSMPARLGARQGRAPQHRSVGSTREGRVPHLSRGLAGKLQLQGLRAGGDGQHPRRMSVGCNLDHRPDAHQEA